MSVGITILLAALMVAVVVIAVVPLAHAIAVDEGNASQARSPRPQREPVRPAQARDRQPARGLTARPTA